MMLATSSRLVLCALLAIQMSAETFKSVVFLGGSDANSARAVTSDGSYLYILGETTSADFPVTPGALSTTNRGNQDLFVVKFDPRSSTIVWATYIGGTGAERAGGIQVDSHGNVFISGTTASTDFPISPDALQKTLGGSTDAFLIKLNPRSSAALFSTYLGGAGAESGALLAIDRAGNLLLGGTTTGGFPTKSGSFQPAFGGGTSDAFLVKINQFGSEIDYATYLGGSGRDVANSLTVDADGNAYLAGNTGSTNFAVSTSAIQKQFGGGTTDGFVAKLNPTGTTALYATYFGGADDDDVVGLFVPQDAGATKDNIYLALSTTSRNLPVSATAFLRTYNGGASDGYLARLSSNGAELVSATYLGGAGDDKLGAMTVDATGVVAVVFSSTSEAWGPADQRQKTGHSRSAGIQSAFDPYVQIQLMLASMQNALLHRQLEPTCEGAGNQLHYVSMSGAMLAAVGNTSISNPSTCAANSTLVGKTGKTLATLAYTSTPPPPAIVFPPISKYRIQGIVGDPISTASGELHDTHVDISLGGPMRLIFARHYSSRLGALGVFGSLGNNWMHLYEQTADVQDNVATVTLFEGRQLTFRRASAAAPWQLEGAAPTGYVLQSAAGGLRLLSYIARTILQFNAAGQLTRIEDRNGNSVVLTPSAIGPTLADDGLGRTLQFTYAAGHLTRVTDQGGRSISFSYTGDDLTTVTGLNGRLTDYTYTSAGAQTGLMTSKTPPLGNKLLTWAYDAQGRVMEETNSLGGKLRLDYGADGRTTITDAAGKATIHTHAAGQALTSMVDSAGKPSELSYDTSNRRTGVTDRDGNKFGVTYHSPTGYIASLTDAAGATMYTYAAQVQAGWTHYNLAKITYPDGAAESFTFDARGNITAGTMRDGKERKHTFNARGQALTGTNGSGATVTYTYGDDATLATATLPGGEQRTYGYDSLKRLVKVTHPDGASQAFSHTASSLPAGSVNELGGVTEFSYTGNDQVATRTDPLGRITTLTYDTEGRQTSFTDGNGAVTSYLYAANGKLAGLTEPSGRTRRFEYDSSDNVRAVSDDLGKWQEFEYSSEGKMTAIKDALDRVTRAEYRNLQPVTRTLPSGATVAYRYGASNQLTGYTDPVGRTLEFTRDSLGRITSAELPGDATAQWQWSTDGYISQATDPNGGVWKFEYDNLGRITAQVDPLNRRVSYTSDNRGRIARSTNGETSVQFRYGATGQLLGKTYSDGTAMTLQRDALGRLVKGDGIELEWDALRTTRSNGLGIQRDAAGRITAITYAPEKVVQYAYDVRGRVTRVTDWLGGVTKFTYNAANELILAERPNGVSTATEYDSDGSPITITNGSLASIRLTRDAAGRITEADRTMPSNPAPAAATTEFTYDKAHQIATATYDQFGRLLSDGKRTFTWDLAGRLSAFTDGEQSGSFTYDARGGMITWASGSLTRSFVQNYGLRLPSIAVERRDGADFHYFVHLPDGTLLYSISAADGARRFYHFDEAGNTQMLTDDMGAVVASFGVSPFGEVVSQSGEAETPFVYQGMWSIPRIGPGLYAMRARVYDAAAARFLSPDPVQPSLLYSTSVYHYAMSNPLLFNDPTGRDLGSMFWGAVNTVGSWFGYNSDPPTPEPAWVPYQEPEPVRIVSFAPAEISITSIPVAPPLVPLNPFAAASSVNFSLSASGVKFLSNLISGNGSTLTWQQQQVVQRIIANGGGNIVANGGGNIVALGGGNLTRADLDILASVMSGNGSTFTDAGRAVIAGIVALGGGNIIANGGGNIVALGGGNFAAAFEKVTALDANGNAFAGLNAASLQDSVSRMTAANFSF